MIILLEFIIFHFYLKVKKSKIYKNSIIYILSIFLIGYIQNLLSWCIKKEKIYNATIHFILFYISNNNSNNNVSYK